MLRTKQIVTSRKEGNQVFYSLRDPVLIDVLDILKRYFSSHFVTQHGYASRDSKGKGDLKEMSGLLGKVNWERWRPKLLVCLKDYNRGDLISDTIAGLTVGLVALPLAMAFGIASGVTPQAGIYTAIVGGLLISALGGSKIQIGGPTGAFVVIVAGIIAKFGLSGLLMVTMMAGVILLSWG